MEIKKEKKENKLIVGLLVGVMLGIIIGVVSAYSLIQKDTDLPADEQTMFFDETFPQNMGGEFMGIVEAEITKINIAENYLMVKSVWPQKEEEVKVKINPETIIEKSSTLEQTINDIQVGQVISFSGTEDMRNKTEITQIDWFTVHTDSQGVLDELEGLQSDLAVIDYEVFHLDAEILEVNPQKNYLIVKPLFPALPQERVKVILEAGKTFPVFKIETKTIYDLTINDSIMFETTENINEKQVIENVNRIHINEDGAQMSIF